MLDTTPQSRAAAFLSKLEAALAAGDVEAAANMFAPESYWRDLVAFTWNIKTVEGRDQIKDMLRACLPNAKPRNWTLAENETATETDGVLQAWFTFETEVGRGYGLARIKPEGIWTFLTTLVELKGHEERQGFSRPLGAAHGVNKHGKTWKERREDEAATLGHSVQPYVLVIGGGQGAIGLGARLRQLDVPTIIVEKNPRPGDSWRVRYKSLCLHDPVWYDHMPYIDFPANWPIFSPKDKIGDWLEMYAKVMELNYWGSTTAKRASFDEAKKEWTVVVEQGGKELTLRPKQLVFATGITGKPHMPKFKGMERFKGDQHHSSQHPGPDAYKGKRVVVIGSNNSAHDICAALYENDVDVTMVQRSSTNIVRSEPLMEHGLGDLYSERALARRDHDAEGRSALRLDPLSHPAYVHQAGDGQDPRARRGFLRRARKSGIQGRFRRRRVRADDEIPPPRLRLLHRHRRVAAHHRRQDQAGGGTGRGSCGGGRSPRQRPGYSRRRDRLRHRLRLDERFR